MQSKHFSQAENIFFCAVVYLVGGAKPTIYALHSKAFQRTLLKNSNWFVFESLVEHFSVNSHNAFPGYA